MTDHYEGDGYEFSIRLLGHRRLLVHVTRATLEFLAGGELVDQLSTLTAFTGLLRERASLAHANTGAARVVLEPSDVAGLNGTETQRLLFCTDCAAAHRIEGGASEWRTEPSNRGPRSSFGTPQRAHFFSAVATSCRACCRCTWTIGNILLASAFRSASFASACVFFSSVSVASWSPTPACFT